MASAAALLVVPDTSTAGTRRALLIGINDYEVLPTLRGAVNDVETTRALLTNRFGFEDSGIRVLLDRDATRAGILAALERLVEEAGPDDTVYIHYSGHGSQVADQNGDEADGLDETLCPRDARTEGVADITDDELDAILGRLKAASAIVVLDSCHSGTALRAADLRIRDRLVAPDTREHLYQITHRAIVPVPLQERHKLFTGAASHQSALDGPFDGTRYHGLFSFALTRSLAGAAADASPRDIMAAVENELERITPRLGGRVPPEPQLEAPAPELDRPLFGPAAGPIAATPRLAWAEAGGEGKDGILLRRGVAMGALPGSIWAIYPAAEIRFGPGEASARVIVTATRGEDSLAEVLSGAVPTAPGWRAVLAAPAPSSPDLTPSTAAQLAEIHNPASGMKLDLRVAGAEEPEAVRTGTRGVMLTADVAPEPLSFHRAGEPRGPHNSLQLEVRSSHDCFLSIVDIDSAGNVALLFPNGRQRADFLPDGAIAADEAVRIPDSLRSGNRAGFHFDYGPPAGHDMIRAFCATRLQDARALRTAVSALGGAGTNTRGALDDLRLRLSEVSTRGVVTVPDAPSSGPPSTNTGPASAAADWTATSITLVIGNPG